jgi:hypothetical protein
MINKNPKVIPNLSRNKPNNVFKIPWPFIVKSLLLLIIVGGLFYLIFYSSFFNVSNLIVEGAQLTEESQVETLALDYLNSNSKNIFTLSSTDLKRNLDSGLPLVSSVIIQKGIPDTIKVILEEREPAIIWETSSKRYLVDDQGYVFLKLKDYLQKKDLLTEDLIKLNDRSGLPVEKEQRLVSSSWIEFVKQIDKKLLDRFDLAVSKYYIIESAFDLYGASSKGELIFDTNRSVSEQIQALKTLFESTNRKKYQYIDLRIAGWVYYK